MARDLKQRAMAQPQQTTGKGGDSLAQKVDAMQAQFAAAMPRGKEAVQLIRDAHTCLRMTPKLAECEHTSVLGALMTCAQLGLRPGVLGQAYLLPMYNGKQRRMEAQLIIGYQGLLELIYRSGMVQMVQARRVHENDEFVLEYGLEGDKLIHRPPASGPRGRVVKWYAIARFKDGGYAFTDPVSREEMEAHRDKYAMAKTRDGKIVGPWVTQFDEMADKGLALDTPIPTDGGWSTMGDLSVGDVVFDMNGDRTHVIAKSEVKNIGCYRVTLANGDVVVCDDEHRWLAGIGSNAARDGWKVQTIGEMYAAKQAGKAVTVPVAGAIDLPAVDLPIDPWLLGYWLGDGNSYGAQLTCSADDLTHVAGRVERAGYTIGAIRPDPRSNGRNVTFGVRGGLKKALADAGLITNKHVPDVYLRGSFEQRQALLQGLIDSDGHVSKDRGRVLFCNTNPALIDAVVELAASLGEVPARRWRTTFGFGKRSRHEVVEWQPSVLPATLPRKVKRVRPRKIAAYRSVKSIEPIESVPTQCIAVDSPTHTYLAGRTMVPTHNTVLRRLAKTLPKSPEVAWAIENDGAIRQDYTEHGIEHPVHVDSEVVVEDAPAVEADPKFNVGGGGDTGGGAPVKAPQEQQGAAPAPKHDRANLVDALDAAFTDQKITAQKDRLEWLANLVGDQVTTVDDLTDDEIVGAIDVLNGKK